MLLVNYEAPNGLKRHNKLFNGGNGYGIVKLYKGKELIDTANSGFDSFLDESRKIFNKIMDNWAVGPGKQEAEDSFEQFLSVSNRYKEILSNASLEITNALKSYNL